MSSIFSRLPFSRRQPAAEAAEDAPATADNLSELSDGSLNFISSKSGNGGGVAYQEAHGAPVEVESPLGYAVGDITIIFLNVSKMIGTGVYSTPAAILKGTGSVGVSMIFWFIGLIATISTFSVYLEFASYFPNRSGAEVVYLEQAYPRPRYLLPTAFAFLSVVLSFSSGNSIVLAQYLFRTSGVTPTGWQLKGVAVAGYTVAFLLVAANTKVSYWASNGIGIVKVITLVFIGITGLVVLGGHTSVPAPHANFDNSFDGVGTAYGVTNALYKIVFSYAGFENAFNVVNEVKNPIKKLRNNGFISIGLVSILYILANIAYFAAVPKKDILTSTQVVASLFFKNVFGDTTAVRGLNFLIALSSFGNLVAVLLGSSRVLRECGRQGVLPWPRFWASTRPLGTPLGPYAVKWALTVLMILAPPAGDAFNFIVDLQVFPNSFFNLVMAVGLYVVRWRRRRIGLGRAAFRAWDPLIIFNILLQTFLVIMPWYPPAGGIYAGDVSFWYATYAATGVGILVGCAIYYYVWIDIIPRLRGYRIRQEVLVLGDGSGANTHKLVKVPVADLAQWDATHDHAGQVRGADEDVSDSGKRDVLVDEKHVSAA